MSTALKGIDWKLLGEQKEWLALQHGVYADGLLSLLDAIQDDAVNSGLFTEEEVFGKVLDKLED